MINKISNNSLIEKAIQLYGLTTNPKEAGFILPDGKMLDFSEGRRNDRSLDHRNVVRLLDDADEYTSEHSRKGITDAMEEFMRRTGAIRVSGYVSNVLIDCETTPTAQQWQAVNYMIKVIRPESVAVSPPGTDETYYVDNPNIQSVMRAFNKVEDKQDKYAFSQRMNKIAAEFWGSSASGIILTCKEDQTIFLAKRSKDVQDPGVWGSVGGAIDAEVGDPLTDDESPNINKFEDQDYRDNALQEAREELGSIPKFEKLEAVTNFTSRNFTYKTYIYNISSSEKNRWTNNITLNWENDDCGWFKYNALPKPIHPGVMFSLGQLGDLSLFFKKQDVPMMKPYDKSLFVKETPQGHGAYKDMELRKKKILDMFSGDSEADKAARDINLKKIYKNYPEEVRSTLINYMMGEVDIDRSMKSEVTEKDREILSYVLSSNKYLYHVTTRRNLIKIMRDGLKMDAAPEGSARSIHNPGSYRHGVYLATGDNSAMWMERAFVSQKSEEQTRRGDDFSYSRNINWNDQNKTYILRVPVNSLNKDKFAIDDIGTADAVFYLAKYNRYKGVNPLNAYAVIYKDNVPANVLEWSSLTIETDRPSGEIKHTKKDFTLNGGWNKINEKNK